MQFHQQQQQRRLEVLLKGLPLPRELVYSIASYDRALSVKRLSPNDPRYAILRDIYTRVHLYPYKLRAVLYSSVYFTNSSSLWVFASQTQGGKVICYTYASSDGNITSRYTRA